MTDKTFDQECREGPYAEDCNKEHYSPVALNPEDWKEYVKQKGWD